MNAPSYTPRCDNCQGTGQDPDAACPRCGGSGHRVLGGDQLLTPSDLSEAQRKQAAGEAQAASVRAIYQLIDRLKHELDGLALRGMPNLGYNSKPYHAALVRVKRGAHTRKPKAPPTPAKLALTPHGDLVMVAWRHEDNAWDVREPREDELMAEDAEKLANTVVECVAAHGRAMTKSTGRLKSIKRFADRLYEVCEFE